MVRPSIIVLLALDIGAGLGSQLLDPVSLSDKAKKTQREILQAAAAAFSERGFNATTMRIIAEDAGVTQAAIHHYFGSKQGLFQEVFRTAVLELRTAQPAEVPSGVGFLVHGLPALFWWLGKNRQVRRLAMWARLEGRVLHPADADEMLVFLRRWITRAQADGWVRRDVDPDATLVVLDAMFKGYWDRAEDPWVTQIDAIAERALEQMMTLVIRGLLTEQGLAAVQSTVPGSAGPPG